MTKQDILNAIQNGEVSLSDGVRQAVEEKLATMPDGEWSEQDEMAFDDFLVEMSDEYFAASDELNLMANDLEEAADQVDMGMKRAANQTLDTLYTTAKTMQNVAATE